MEPRPLGHPDQIAECATDRLWLATELPGGMVLQALSLTGVWRALCDTLDVLPRN